MCSKRLAILSGIAIVASMLALTPEPAGAGWAGGGGYHGGESGGFRGGGYSYRGSAHRTHHRHYAINPNASPPMTQYSYGGMGPGHDQYMKNLHDAGYDPKNDYGSNGILRDH